jgi:sugar O-acyltransferase (sialic acid O-acetyltransferase NeuD family)
MKQRKTQKDIFSEFRDISEIYIIGDGGLAHEFSQYADNKYCVIVGNHGSLTDEQYLSRCQFRNTILAVGSPDLKQKLYTNIMISNPKYITYMHKSVVSYGVFGDGCIIAPNVVVSSNVNVGDHVLINYSATIGHDTAIGDFVTISPQAAINGRCKINNLAYIGSGAIIKENLTIGEKSIIGMGAVVTKNVPAKMVAVGNPARFVPIEEWNKNNKKIT